MSLFSPLMKRKREKNWFFNYFWRMLLKFEEKNLETHKLSWLLITWMLKKLNSIQTLVEKIPEIKLSHWYLRSKTYIKSYSKTRTLIPLNKFVCYPNNRLVLLRILSYRESSVVAPISSLIYKIFIFFHLAFDNTFSILKSTHSANCQGFQNKTISGIFVQLNNKPPYFCPPEVIPK